MQPSIDSLVLQHHHNNRHHQPPPAAVTMVAVAVLPPSTSMVSFNAHTRVLRIKNMPTEPHDVHQRWAIAAVGEWPLDGLLNRDEVRLLCGGVGRTIMSQCLNCNAPFADDAQLIEVALHDTTTDVHLDHHPLWVEAFFHPGMSYQSVVAHIMQIARATFGQAPVVTGIQVIADDFQWTA
ncbi:hypothetical protein IFM61606_02317 [Aspergillus udagawae]|nr:hypothetical protein IFM61606_02317 [Aspergillus udagawae]